MLYSSPVDDVGRHRQLGLSLAKEHGNELGSRQAVMPFDFGQNAIERTSAQLVVFGYCKVVPATDYCCKAHVTASLSDDAISQDLERACEIVPR
jgi:hypothetical protein